MEKENYVFSFSISLVFRNFAVAMNRLRHLFVWLSRIHLCRGFGIQSPTDYQFVRYVINEHWPYYAYSTLGLYDGWLDRKVGCLLFRLVNWLQPTTILDEIHKEEYLLAGCRKTVILSTLDPENVAHPRQSVNKEALDNKEDSVSGEASDNKEASVSGEVSDNKEASVYGEASDNKVAGIDLALVADAHDFDRVYPYCTPNSVVVVSDIHRHRSSWKEVVADARVTVSYDLYYCGILMLDPKRVKQHYKINF